MDAFLKFVYGQSTSRHGCIPFSENTGTWIFPTVSRPYLHHLVFFVACMHACINITALSFSRLFISKCPLTQIMAAKANQRKYIFAQYTCLQQRFTFNLHAHPSLTVETLWFFLFTRKTDIHDPANRIKHDQSVKNVKKNTQNHRSDVALAKPD